MSKRTWEEAHAETRRLRVLAVQAGLDRGDTADQLVARYEAEQGVPMDWCEVVEPGFEKFGPCTSEYGHEGPHSTGEYEDPRRSDGSHPWDY